MILLWRITTHCNFSCGFCAYDRRLPIARHAADPDEVERVIGLVADAARMRGEPLLVSWLGGEPMLWRPLFGLSARLARHAAVALSMTSNGTRMDNLEVRRHLLDHFAEVTFSLDGPASVHDGLRGAPGAYDRVRSAIVALASERAREGARLKLRANIVLMQATLPSFADLCRTLADWGIDDITFNQLGGRDRPDFFPAQALRPDDSRRLSDTIPALKDELGARGVRLCASPDYLARIDASTRGHPLAVHDCGPGEQFLFVDELGRIGPCSFTLDDHGVAIDQLRTVADVDSLAARFRQSRQRHRAAVCDDCPSTQFFGKFAA
ncbi:radical SAM protein [Sphingomonas sp. LY29]|uniref:radical SAM protein n=1 Tax=Sphingomonas sp. LY29 TaxID=3095341 RepID=UPI002D778F0E|nr:radical SAM protein [Sphingomonas sp. LY29]WRP26772.1 radical SAM protein [Sphingomonas sp. LY29]